MLSTDSHWAFSQNVLGSWLRVDLPSVLRSLRNAQDSFQIPKHFGAKVAAVSKEYVLWTDADIIFRGYIDSCTLAKPQILSVGPELRMGWPENYGLIYSNVSAYTAGFRDLIAWGGGGGGGGSMNFVLITTRTSFCITGELQLIPCQVG